MEQTRADYVSRIDGGSIRGLFSRFARSRRIIPVFSESLLLSPTFSRYSQYIIIDPEEYGTGMVSRNGYQCSYSARKTYLKNIQKNI